MSIEVEAIDTKGASDGLLEELADYYVAVDLEDMPDDPPTPQSMRIAEWRSYPSNEPVLRWALREDGDMAAVGVVVYDRHQNPENGFARIHVRPERRGMGHARELAGPMFQHLGEMGRSRIDTWIKQETPGEGFAEKLGMKSVYFEKRSRLWISVVDWQLMNSWIERAAERAGDYDLLYMDSPIPEEHLVAMSELTQVMNTAPREDFVEEDEIVTPERWREREESVASSGNRLHILVAVHRPTGGFAGYTQIMTQGLQPDLAWQHDTGVDPTHRNKGLGRWLKASMILRIIDEFPEVTRVDTFNAGSNEPMLNINVAMGFRPVHLSNAWQGDLETMQLSLGV